MSKHIDVCKDCWIHKGHHFARIHPDFICRVCGKNYEVFMMSDVYLTEMEKCNGNEEHGAEDAPTIRSNEEPEDSNAGTGGQETTSSETDHKEESSMTCEHKHIDWIMPALCRDCDTYL